MTLFVHHINMILTKRNHLLLIITYKINSTDVKIIAVCKTEKSRNQNISYEITKTKSEQ